MRDRRDRMLSVGPNGLSHAIVGQMQGTDMAGAGPQNPNNAGKANLLSNN